MRREHKPLTHPIALAALDLFVRFDNIWDLDIPASTVADYLPYSWLIKDIPEQNMLIMGAGPGDEGGPRYLTVYYEDDSLEPRIDTHQPPKEFTINHIVMDFEGLQPIFDRPIANQRPAHFMIRGTQDDWQHYSRLRVDPEFPVFFYPEPIRYTPPKKGSRK